MTEKFKEACDDASWLLQQTGNEIHNVHYAIDIANPW